MEYRECCESDYRIVGGTGRDSNSYMGLRSGLGYIGLECSGCFMIVFGR